MSDKTKKFCSQCGNELSVGDNFCTACGKKTKDTKEQVGTETDEEKQQNQPKEEEKKVGAKNVAGESVNNPKAGTEPQKESKDHLKGIEGWLALLGFGLFVSFFISAYGFFDIMSFVGSAGLTKELESVITFEFFGFGILLFFHGYVLYLLVKRRKDFTKFFIVLCIGYFLFGIIDYSMIDTLSISISSELRQESEETIAQSLFYGVIWTLYLLKSKRVKKTMVN